MAVAEEIPGTPRQLGVLIGGSGLIGGALTHYFKKRSDSGLQFLAPNSKRLSLRVADDIRSYFREFRPAFIINAAIAPIDSDPQLALETNYFGAINLARVAISLGVPYIHISSAATLPMGENIAEDRHRQLTPELSNYRKSKLMAEQTLRHMHVNQGLDYTNIRLAVVYGKHDHKIQGFHRLLFSIADQSMPFMFTKAGVKHSYSNTKKLPPFIAHVLANRHEFNGQTIHFVDREPVELVGIIRAIKSYLGVRAPREIYIPYHLASFGKNIIRGFTRALSKIGAEVRLPAEIMFLRNFYQSQTLASDKLATCSYKDPAAELTVFTELPDIIEYYITRWEHLNLISGFNREFFDPQQKANTFLRDPQELMTSVHGQEVRPDPEFNNLL